MTEEEFVFESLKEFVKSWEFGSQASFNLICKNGTARLNISFELKHPTKDHFKHDKVKRKSPSRQKRDNKRANERLDGQRELKKEVPEEEKSTASVLQTTEVTKKKMKKKKKQAEKKVLSPSDLWIKKRMINSMNPRLSQYTTLRRKMRRRKKNLP